MERGADVKRHLCKSYCVGVHTSEKKLKAFRVMSANLTF